MKFFKDNKQVSSQIIRRMARENPKALSLWLGLKDIANGYGICVASQKSLECLLHVNSRMTVYRAVRYLVKNGYIGIAKIGSQRAYILNPNIVQTLKHDKAKEALTNHGMTFVGAIHLTKAENPKIYKETKHFLDHCRKLNGKYSLSHIKHFRSSAMLKRKHIAKAHKLRDKKESKRGWSDNEQRAKRLHIGYQTRIQFPDTNKKQNKKAD